MCQDKSLQLSATFRTMLDLKKRRPEEAEEMYAVIKTGGKQYRVAKDQILKVEKLEVEPGQSYDFEEVLMVANGDQIQLGSPNVAGAKVSAEVVEHGRHKKVEILKFKRRKHHMKRQGHRQDYTKVKITDIA